MGSVIHCLRIHVLSFIIVVFHIILVHHVILILFRIFNNWLAITENHLFGGSWFLAHNGALILLIIDNFSVLKFFIAILLIVVLHSFLTLVVILTLAVTDALLLLIVAEILVVETFFRRLIAHLFFKFFTNSFSINFQDINFILKKK